MRQINDDFVIHDKYRFELKFDYNFTYSKKNKPYQIDTYFFIPASLDINEETFTKSEFYNNLQNYIRLNTPQYNLQSILNKSTGPLSLLLKSINLIQSEKNIKNNLRCAYNLKMFTAIVKDSIKNSFETIQKKIKSKKDTKTEIDNFIKYIPLISNTFKKLKKNIKNIPLIEKISLSALYQSTDEFLSLFIEKTSYEIIQLLQKYKKFPTSIKPLKKIAYKELTYRDKAHYNSVPLLKGTNKDFLYRFSVLKKIVSSVLFLSIKRINRAKRVEQIWFGIAAGLAMVFSTLITLFASWKYGNFTSSFFLLIILAYILKDRIKDLMKFYFTHSFMQSIYDNEIKIFGPLNRLKMGVLKEAIFFIGQEKIEQNITEMRNRDTLLNNSELKESVILYRKKVKLFPKQLNKVYYKGNSIHDITRLNVNPFLLKMDNPYKNIFTLNNDKITKLKAARTYHINIIIKLKTETEIIYKRFRLILSRNGIVKIEKIKSKLSKF